MKIIIGFFIGILFPICIYAQGGKDIKIEYQHSQRIPYNHINIEFYAKQNEYQINVKTTQMFGKEGYENTNTEKTIAIEKVYFNDIYNQLVNLDFTKIILINESIVGSDGFDVKITIGSRQNYIVLSVWSPNYESEKRKLTELNTILKDIFLKIGLSDYL